MTGRDKISKALGDIDPSYIEEAEEYHQSPRRMKLLLPLAACLALVLILRLPGWEPLETESASPSDSSFTGTAEAKPGEDTPQQAAPAEPFWNRADPHTPAADQEKGDSHDFVPMSPAELEEYYGFVLPAVEPSAPQEWGVFRREGTGEVYGDENSFLLSGTKAVLTISKIPADRTAPEGTEPSLIGGREVLFLEDGESLWACWQEQDVQCTLRTQEMEQDSFAALLYEVLGQQKGDTP